MKKIFSEEELSILDSLQIKGGGENPLNVEDIGCVNTSFGCGTGGQLQRQCLNAIFHCNCTTPPNTKCL